MLKPRFPRSPELIDHQQKLLVLGSCFTEHIGGALAAYKFKVLQNPGGILFDPLSVCYALDSYISNTQIGEADLVKLDEVWHSWRHHGRFSNFDKDEVVSAINASTSAANKFLKDANWLIITLGSSFNYRLQNQFLHEANVSKPISVANCHRAPGQWFVKHLMSIDETVAALDNTLHRCFRFNPNLKILFTISPVRHIRDGVVENNRSKARLIEAVHHLVGKFNKLYYFPAYELVIDVLRDYRFYDVDLVHPNYAATQFVLEQFLQQYCTYNSIELIEKLKPIINAAAHRPQHPQTKAHKKFLQAQLKSAQALQTAHPFLDLNNEMSIFSSGL